MIAVRRLLAQRLLAALICAAALWLRLVVPAGYMVGNDHGHLAVTLCSGVADPGMAMAMPGMGGGMPGHGKQDHGKADMPCPFAGLAAPALGGADPALLVVLVAFVVALGLLPAALPALIRSIRARPPLRGPPARL